MNLIIEDALKYPSFFLWNGPIESDVLLSWLQDHQLNVPTDLVSFWELTGGGNVFESEQILGPFGNTNLADDIESNNHWHWNKGMPKSFLLFNIGAFPSAIRLTDLKYVLITENSYQVTHEFSSFDEWYCQTLRLEFSERYGLQ